MLAQRLATWRYVLNTANLPKGMTKPDGISKWLVITRAAVFSMTVTSGLIGGLLAIGAAQLPGSVSIDWAARSSTPAARAACSCSASS